MLKMTVGHSDAIVAEEALAGAMDACRRDLAGAPASAGILYSSFLDADHGAMLAEVERAFPGMPLVGCTTDGEVSVAGYRERSVLLLIFSSDELIFGAGLGRDFSKNPVRAVEQAASQARERAGADPALCIAMPDGLTTIGSPVVESLRQVFDPVPVFGGTAGDRFKLERTWQFFGSEVLMDAVVLLTVCGEVRFSSGVASGWTPVGRKHAVTDAQGNLVHRIGEWTAMDFYRHYLGDNEAAFVQFPLAVHHPEGDGFVLRDPLRFHPEDGSISFVGTLPEQCEVQLAEAGREDILAAACRATDTAVAAYPGERPDGALIFSCCSRHIILGSRTGEELAGVARALGELPVAGFYTYGEIAPLVTGGSTRYHNDTFVLLLLGMD